MANLMPSLSSLRVHLNQFLDLSGASEIVLFERTTFLVISSVTRDARPRREDGGGGEVAEGAKEWDDRRFERISTMVKAFKLGCSKIRSPFSSLSVSTQHYTAVLDTLSPETYILVVADGHIRELCLHLTPSSIPR